MLRVLFTMSALCLLASGCAQPVVLKNPEGVVENGKHTVYFIEQEQNKDSRLRVCQIADDNSATCTIQYEAK